MICWRGDDKFVEDIDFVEEKLKGWCWFWGWNRASINDFEQEDWLVERWFGGAESIDIVFVAGAIA